MLVRAPGGQGPVATNAAELGRGLQHLRSVGLRTLETRQEAAPASPRKITLSRTQLGRYENGHTLPPLKYADHLDQLYEGRGWVAMSIRSLWRPRWDPWTHEHGYLSTTHAFGWPATYSGPVWIKLKPTQDRIDVEHHIVISWGPWTRRLNVHLPGEGLVLLTGKAGSGDNPTVVCDLTADHPLFVLHGIGDIGAPETTLDIRSGWTRT